MPASPTAEMTMGLRSFVSFNLALWDTASMYFKKSEYDTNLPWLTSSSTRCWTSEGKGVIKNFSFLNVANHIFGVSQFNAFQFGGPFGHEC